MWPNLCRAYACLEFVYYAKFIIQINASILFDITVISLSVLW